jgi:large subunit ribosomal protein L25
MSQKSIEITSRKALRANNVQGRKDGYVPAVVYGPKQASTPVFIPNKFFVFNGTNDDDNNIYTLKGDVLEGEQVMIKAITKNPIGNKVLHVDLYAPDMTKSVRVEVEIDFQGEPVGVKESGGLVQTIRRTIEIECRVSEIPKSIPLDISGMAVGDTLKMGDIKVDEKYTVLSAPEYAVVSVTEPRAEEPEETAEAAPAEGAEGAAAPAAEGGEAPATGEAKSE